MLARETRGSHLMARDWARARAAAACLVFVALLVFGAAPALAQFGERYALVIGNSDYAHVEALPNTARDAGAMAEALEALRFTVFRGIDLTAEDFERLIEEFDQAAADADTVVFYYAGHGFQLNGLNHLAPVDAVLRDRARINAETFVLDDIVARIHRRQRQTIVFLDACRNNPLPASAQDGAGAGLAQVGTGDGTFIAFATQPGNVSYDGTGKNSPFTEALLTHIGKPNRNISSLMIDVRNEVSDRTLGRQVPWDQSSLRADFHFNPVPEPAAQQYVASREPAAGGLVIGRTADSAIRGRGDAGSTVPGPVPGAGASPAPRQSPLTIGPAPVNPPAATGPAGPAAQPETLTAARTQGQTPKAPVVTPRARPESVAPAASARPAPDTAAPVATARAARGTATPAATGRATPDTVTPAASTRAAPGKVAALARDIGRPESVTAAPTARARPDSALAATAALAHTEAASFAPVERLRPDREWFPDDAAPPTQDGAEAARRRWSPAPDASLRCSSRIPPAAIRDGLSVTPAKALRELTGPA
jgi:uncharacterized caspase-like protein